MSAAPAVIAGKTAYEEARRWEVSRHVQAWEDLPQLVRDKWIQVARVIKRAHYEEGTGHEAQQDEARAASRVPLQDS